MRVYSNVADLTSLNGAVTDAATTITLVSTAGWPVPGSGDVALACLDFDSDDGTVREVVTYTGITGNDLTGVTRGVDGTTAQAHSDGASVAHVASAADIEQAQDSGASGAVVQVVTATYDQQDIISSESFQDSGLTASITPQHDDSILIVDVSAFLSAARNSGSHKERVGRARIRNTTDNVSLDGAEDVRFGRTLAADSDEPVMSRASAGLRGLYVVDSTASRTFRLQLAAADPDVSVLLQGSGSVALMTITEVSP